MTIGIDVSVLQTHHRMRGIGYTLINFIKHIPADAKEKHRFVFYLYEDVESPLELLHLDGLKYEVRYIAHHKHTQIKLPGKLSILNGSINQWRTNLDLYLGDPRIKNFHDVDVFMQFDQNQPLPPKRRVKSALVIYDLIPFVMERDYLWSYKTARANGRTRKGALRVYYHRFNYINRLKKVTGKAHRLLAISAHTKKDFIQHVGINSDRITVCTLGVEEIPQAGDSLITLKKYRPSSWGPLPEKVDLSNTKFLLFVGGADPRRKLTELVAAFNNLRAQGHDIRLVLAGDTMRGPFEIPNPELQEYFKNTSYLDDIYFMGFVDDIQREWLYKHALVFIYPSVYEGFGLPVLEAMQHGTPVITFKNSSIEEVAGNSALYATNYQDIQHNIELLMYDAGMREKYAKLGVKRAAMFPWSTTVKNMLKQIAN